jgi:hypothetical protein
VSECEANDTLLIQACPLTHAAALWEKTWVGSGDDGGADADSQIESRWESMRLHRIASESVLELSATTETPAHWDFLCRLRDKGRFAAEAWLREHGADVGVRSSFDVPVTQ